MSFSNLTENYFSQLEKLSEIIDRTIERVLSDPPDPLFFENVNFYAKSYLINLCSITEACLKDTAMLLVRRMSARLSDAKVAHNLVMWSIYKDNFEDSKHASYGVFSLKIDEKSLNEKLSANPWKAIKLFQMVGCDLMKSADFSEVKNVVGTVVEKRNNVVHHNDLANDISLSDVKGYIVVFKKYIGSVSSSCQLVEPLDL